MNETRPQCLLCRHRFKHRASLRAHASHCHPGATPEQYGLDRIERKPRPIGTGEVLPIAVPPDRGRGKLPTDPAAVADAYTALRPLLDLDLHTQARNYLAGEIYELRRRVLVRVAECAT